MAGMAMSFFHRKSLVALAKQLVLQGAEPREAVIVDLDLGSKSLRVIATHFGFLRHSRKLLTAAELQSEKLTALVGDLN